jgi:phosphoglycolate phosphatase
MSQGDVPPIMTTPYPALAAAQAVLFDLDGTLVETDNRWAGVAAQKLAPLKRLFPRLNVDALGRRLVMASETPANYVLSLLEHLGISTRFWGLTDRLRRAKGLATREAAVLVEGTLPLLEALAPRYKLAVVTTRARPEARAFLELAGLARFFPVVITRQDVLRMKPYPEPVQRAAERLGVSPAQCLMVGDTTMDILAARRAGAFAVAVLSGFGEREELERAGAQLILGSAVELMEYLPSANTIPA